MKQSGEQWEVDLKTDSGMVCLLLLLERRCGGILVVHRDPGLPSDFSERGGLN